VVGKQTDVGLEQTRHALLLQPDQTCILATPEIAVMHDDRIGVRRERGIEQFQAGGHPGHDLRHTGPTFHLQTVWAIILDRCHIEQLIQIARQRGQFHAVFLARVILFAFDAGPGALR